MAHLEIAFDGLISLFVLVMVWKALVAKELYQSAVFFIAFGLAVAMIWARLSAPGVALAAIQLVLAPATDPALHPMVLMEVAPRRSRCGATGLSAAHGPESRDH